MIHILLKLYILLENDICTFSEKYAYSFGMIHILLKSFSSSLCGPWGLGDALSWACLTRGISPPRTDQHGDGTRLA